VEFGHSEQDLEGHQSHQAIRTIFLNRYYQSMLKGIKSHDLSVMSKWFEFRLRNLLYKGLKRTKGLRV
jgi:hypothetical protein